MERDEGKRLARAFIDLIQSSGDTDSYYFDFIEELLREGEHGVAVDSLALHAVDNGLAVPDALVDRYKRYCNEYRDADEELEEFLTEQKKLKAERASAK